CAHCPPHTPPIEEVKTTFSKYTYALLMDLVVPPEIIAGKEAEETKSFVPSGLKMYNLVSKIEAEAFYDGYPFALGFAVGSCKFYFCAGKECTVLTTTQGCRKPLLSRPSMEAMGINVFAMAAEAGWDIYPIGHSSNPAEVGVAHRIGIVFIY
ncbi:DUF2284 domain-containing protein, partial [Chloroflexota bacterium]